ncbi:hypothetical protein [Neptunomonas antarctica]|uniref:Uncharacterized protein n=1 Tax=Neptunomonas antarctica TaxID=619304 RepID=A0A1N7P1A1_9GAMM|nr:hypothetical protein [Neptunomonas antarctica]SIT04219.1 hypothetical protein SAMN05421760_1128 [Neptunomonas antarctica]
MKMSKTRREELHRVWLAVTGTAVTAINRADGYKGDFITGQGYELLRPSYLHDEDLQDPDLPKKANDQG